MCVYKNILFKKRYNIYQNWNFTLCLLFCDFLYAGGQGLSFDWLIKRSGKSMCIVIRKMRHTQVLWHEWKSLFWWRCATEPWWTTHVQYFTYHRVKTSIQVAVSVVKGSAHWHLDPRLPQADGWVGCPLEDKLFLWGWNCVETILGREQESEQGKKWGVEEKQGVTVGEVVPVERGCGGTCEGQTRLAAQFCWR